MAQNATRGISCDAWQHRLHTGHAKTACLLGKVCTHDIVDTTMWYLKLWQIKTFGFCILFFGMAES
jgi:hypothetical protein